MMHSLVVVLSSFTPLRLNTNSAVCRNFTPVYFNLAYHNCAQSVLSEAKPQRVAKGKFSSLPKHLGEIRTDGSHLLRPVCCINFAKSMINLSVCCGLFFCFVFFFANDMLSSTIKNTFFTDLEENQK